MPIVQAGKQFTAADLKLTAGNLASFLHDHIQDATDFATQLATWTEPDLLALGLTTEEVNAIKGFYTGDMPAVAAAFAASTWVKQLLGLGV